MLILARQQNERIVMPTVPATIEVVAVKPNGVRLGIDAPPEVTVLREEVLRRGDLTPRTLLALSEADAEARLGRIKHLLGHRLKAVALGLDVVRKQLASTEDSELIELLQRMESEVRRLDRQLHALLSVSVPPAGDIRADPPCAVVEAGDGLSI
jgi:carbon storage regulator CsrA